MGTVYRAWQRSIGREVAIKLLDQRHASDEMSVRRFLREAKLASQLSQPNTISVFDFGQAEDGKLFIVMELVRGRTLRDVLMTEGKLDVSRALRICVQLCDALEAAHGLDIVHRDLKPANLLILDEPPGRDLLKVLDFGLAKSLAGNESMTTDSGFVVGTPRYMAPEVALGGEPSAQSDLYAVGVLLAELTTGERLWEQNDFSQLVLLKNRGLPETPQVPAALRPLLIRLVSPEPRHRPASASALRTALQALADGADVGSDTVRDALDSPAQPRVSAVTTVQSISITAVQPRGRPVLVIGGVAAVVLAAALTIWASHDGGEAAPAQAALPAIDAAVQAAAPIDAAPAMEPTRPDAAPKPAVTPKKKPPPKKKDGSELPF
jgi:serine/threonine-protein kinase